MYQENWNEEDRKEIENNAYFKWIDAGKPQGKDRFFWEQAEAEKIRKEVTHFKRMRALPKRWRKEAEEMSHPEEIIELNYHSSYPKRLFKKLVGTELGNFYNVF